ncbi:protein phosphatase 2C domain-containing protein [Desulfobacterales bacterium HSG16]|nr:protein phosphatase 2C domain-containing protein [Desulfobacterales bacterium HSG16]
MVVIESAGITDVGKKRKGNEDSYFVNDNLQVYVVADGMGGHLAGEVASSLVVKTVEGYMKRARDGHSEGEKELVEKDENLSKEANQLMTSIHLSNRVVYQVSKNKQSCSGMGSTVSAICFTRDTLVVANVGDSPIYMIRNGKIETLSVLHTVIAEQKALYPQGGGQSLGKKYDHMLTRAMGVEKTVKPDVCEIQCFKDDTLILASDGLTDKVRPDEIFEIVSGKSPKEACPILVDLANERGGDDNITIVIVKVIMVKYKRSGVLGWISQFFK